jgi:hypothetical protein
MLLHCIVTEEMSSRLPCDPHPRTTKKTVASAAAVQLLLRRGGRGAAKDESIEFFSALRECQPDRRVSGQTGENDLILQNSSSSLPACL